MNFEHGIESTGVPASFNPTVTDPKLAKIDTYYREGSAGKFIPRAVLVDMDPGSLDTIRAGQLG